MDLYPVTLTLPDGTEYRKCKARIDGAGVTVWAWDQQARTGVVAYESPDVTQESSKRWLSGDVTLVKGCSCAGGPLQRWRPPAGNEAVAG